MLSIFFCFLLFIDYFCEFGVNIYSIDFIRFKICDMEIGIVFFEIVKFDNIDDEIIDNDDDFNVGCFVRYKFILEFLKLIIVGVM